MKPAAFRHRNLPHLLLQARETLMAGFRPILRQYGVTEQQWRLMRTLNEQGEMEPNQLADACLILSPSLTRMLSSMEEAGLIHRSRSTTDQRRQLISLTDLCRNLVAEMEPLIDRRYGELEQLVGADRLAKVYAAVDEMLMCFGEETAERP
ncbi:homoprotocatechuate degradation operon regulator, HpaR [Cupriavidus sp. USMAHM13]|uniref:Homoprotocatechuate degradation operon regulator, HpaR n=1 Tax=Cupriavidus malaysiensis TaxID=367825 RepID=A0ABM6F589_9BURK|nr:MULTISPECIES: homoprotocatechuate degradation operon regulator HpaR [Cupriavidus]AOZ00046.1 homoprotocatechuate degradation operon regulator, HpaR [Cupriavidus sp. USMAHM13]AOZ06658.1 homoprotocatechuate degradation operon regulator, HpaR [Cupriavidus malaysiensis]